MPEAILKFDLPDESYEFRMANHGAEYYVVLWDMDQWLRERLKYGNLPDEQVVILEEVRSKLNELMDEKGVRFE